MNQEIIAQLNRECDELAASHWSLAAGDRELAYKKWILACKKIANYIEKNNDSKQKITKIIKK
jgi:hypothetical protein